MALVQAIWGESYDRPFMIRSILIESLAAAPPKGIHVVLRTPRGIVVKSVFLGFVDNNSFVTRDINFLLYVLR